MEFNIYSFDELTTQQLYDMMAHRFEVFVLGRGDIYRDFDYFDQQAKHLIATDENGKVQGYVRLLSSGLHYDGYAENAFGRLSVKQEARCHGLGKELVRRACAYLIENNKCKLVRISAMAYLEDYYAKLGFVRTSDVFDIQGVPHVTMLYQPE